MSICCKDGGASHRASGETRARPVKTGCEDSCSRSRSLAGGHREATPRLRQDRHPYRQTPDTHDDDRRERDEPADRRGGAPCVCVCDARVERRLPLHRQQGRRQHQRHAQKHDLGHVRGRHDKHDPAARHRRLCAREGRRVPLLQREVQGLCGRARLPRADRDGPRAACCRRLSPRLILRPPV